MPWYQLPAVLQHANSAVLCHEQATTSATPTASEPAKPTTAKATAKVGSCFFKKHCSHHN